MKELNPGPATLAHVDKNGEDWTLVLVKNLKHPPEKVWEALTDPVHLREWSPFDADKSLAAGERVTLTIVNAPSPVVTETEVVADYPRRLEYQWGGGDMRWELAPTDAGTMLTLWAKIERNYIAMGAAGWHVCFSVLERWLDGDPVGRIVGPDALQFGDWQRLHREYSEQFGVEMPKW